MGGGAIIAAAQAARQHGHERVIDAYRLSQATSTTQARTLQELGVEPNNWVDELRQNGVLKPGMEPDSWYLDESAYVIRRNARSARSKVAVRIVAGVVLILLVAGILVQMQINGRPLF